MKRLLLAIIGVCAVAAVPIAPTMMAAGQDTHDKVWVCKYVGKPGVDERLKAGKNPISVDYHSGREPGGYFEDAQGRSYVVAWDVEGEEAPSADQCPAPASTVDVPAEPTVTDPCGDGNATWQVPANDETFSWELRYDGHLVVTIVAEGVTFPDGTTRHDFGTAPDSGKECGTFVHKAGRISACTGATVTGTITVTVAVANGTVDPDDTRIQVFGADGQKADLTRTGADTFGGELSFVPVRFQGLRASDDAVISGEVTSGVTCG